MTSSIKKDAIIKIPSTVGFLLCFLCLHPGLKLVRYLQIGIYFFLISPKHMWRFISYTNFNAQFFIH